MYLSSVLFQQGTAFNNFFHMESLHYKVFEIFQQQKMKIVKVILQVYRIFQVCPRKLVKEIHFLYDF